MMDTVWLYYWQHLGRYAHAYADLTAAMIAAEALLDSEEGAIEAIVDTDGTEYNDFDAVRAWMDAYRKAHPAPVSEETEQKPFIFRDFRGQLWNVIED